MAYAGFYLCRKNFAVAMPLLAARFGFSQADFARVLFCDSLAYCLAQFAFGFLADRAGARRTVVLGCAISVGAALMMSQAGTVAAFAALAAMNGLGQAAGWPALVKNVGAWFPRRRRGIVMGWWSTNYMVGGFAGAAFTSWIATHPTLWPELAWRRAFLMPALLLAVIGFVYLLLARNRPTDVGLAEVERAPAQAAHLDTSALAAMLHDPAVWVVSAGALLSKVLRYSFMFWLPLYLVQRFHTSARDSGFLSSAFELAGPAGSLLAGYLSDRFLRSRRLPVAALLYGCLAGACWLHPWLAASGRAGLLFSIAAIGAFNHGPDALLQGAAAQDLGAKWGVGLVAGFVNGFASLGQLIAPLLVAFVSARYGWDSVFQVLTVFSLAAALILAGGPREKA
jgi:sugar phosphate permease